MDTTIITAIIQGVIQIATIIGAIWGIFNKQQRDLEIKLTKKMDRFETKLNLTQRPFSAKKFEEDK